MEVYKQEKVQRGTRRLAPLVLDPEPDAPSSLRPLPTASSLRHVDSIVEDDEEGSSPKQKLPRSQQPNVAAANQPLSMPPSNRSRSISTSGVQPMTRKPLRTPPANVPSAFPGRLHTLSNSASNPNISYTRTAQASSRSPDMNHGAPVRKSTRQRNRESIDLDDIMNGSDDDELDAPAPPPVPPIGKRAPKVSSTTRELMDFLAEGPPDVGPRNVPMMEYGASTASLDKPKGNRLQRMISKLNIGNEKPKAPENTAKGPHYRPVGVHQSPQGGALSPLANRPIPPRPPRPPQPISPPSSPSQVSLAEELPKAPPPRKYAAPPPQDHHHINHVPNHNTPHPPSPSRPNPQQQASRSNSKEIPPSPKIVHHVNGNGIPKQVHTKPSIPDTQTPPLPPPGVPPPTRKPVPIPLSKPVPNPVPSDTKEAPIPTRPAENSTPAPTSISSEADLRDLQRRFANATSADECRLIFDMFLTRSGVKLSTAASPKGLERKAPYPSPSPSLIKQSPQITPTAVDDITALETSVIELLLGESGAGGSGGRRSPVATAAAPAVPISSPQPHQQLQSESRSPSPPKPRRLPQVPKPEREPAPIHGNGNGQQVGVPQREKEQEKTTTIPITTTNTTTWKNTAEFPTHAGTNSTLIPA